MDPLTFAITTVAPLPPGFQPTLIPMRSASFNKAYLVFGTNQVVPFQTDPAMPPVSFMNIPVADALLGWLVE
jgi:hypothetical protein